MELLDVLDEHGQLSGQVKARDLVHRDGDWHRSVHCWIINPKRELLIQKRGPDVVSRPNLWDISFAGHILTGQTSQQTVYKEGKEELGLELSDGDSEYLFSTVQQTIENNGTFIHNAFHDVYLVQTNLSLSQFQLQASEVAEIKFIHFTELERILKEKPRDFVGHPDEYQKLFTLLHKRYS